VGIRLVTGSGVNLGGRSLTDGVTPVLDPNGTQITFLWADVGDTNREKVYVRPWGSPPVLCNWRDSETKFRFSISLQASSVGNLQLSANRIRDAFVNIPNTISYSKDFPTPNATAQTFNTYPCEIAPLIGADEDAMRRAIVLKMALEWVIEVERAPWIATTNLPAVG
jgi:hypothetical protein